MISRIDKLANLRTSSILAHGFEGISKEEIYKKMGQDEKKDFVGWIEEIFEEFKNNFKGKLSSKN